MLARLGRVIYWFTTGVTVLMVLVGVVDAGLKFGQLPVRGTAIDPATGNVIEVLGRQSEIEAHNWAILEGAALMAGGALLIYITGRAARYVLSNQ